MATYGRVTFNRGGRNSRFDCNNKIELFEVFPNLSSNKMTSCKNSDQTCFSDTATSDRPLKVVKTFQAQVSKLASGPSRY